MPSKTITLRALREEAGISQEALALAVGVAQTTISRYERGTRRTTPDRMALLLSIINQNRGTDSAKALESDSTRTTLELLKELAALKDVFRAVGLELLAGGDAASLHQIGEGALARMQQIAAALLSRSHGIGGTQ